MPLHYGLTALRDDDCFTDVIHSPMVPGNLPEPVLSDQPLTKLSSSQSGIYRGLLLAASSNPLYTGHHKS